MLARLLDEQLGEADYASMVEHVESCTSCQDRLKELTNNDSLLFEWKQIDRSATHPWLPGTQDGISSPSRPQSNPPFYWESQETEAPSWSIDQDKFILANHEERRSDARSADSVPPVEGYEILAKLGHEIGRAHV